MKFRKNPLVIEATQWFKNGDHPNDYDKERVGFDGEEMRTWSGEYARQHGWEGEVVRYYRVPHIPGDRPCPMHCGHTMHDHGWIDTLEGEHIVCPGDWIITGIKGERYPVKEAIFRATYEAEDAPTPPMQQDERVHDPWYEALDNELVVCGILNQDNCNDPRRALRDIINWHVQVSLDPAVSSDAQKLIEQGRQQGDEALEVLRLVLDALVWEVGSEPALCAGQTRRAIERARAFIAKRGEK